jgi:2-hydroxychromene-2-carboxylate isomerase/predicted thioesterase
MKPIVTGTRYRHDYLPDDSATASSIGNPGVDVLSTPALIGYLEHTCHLLVEPCYEGDEATVGTRVEVDHLAAGAIGRAVTVTAELVAHEGPVLEFEAQAAQEGNTLMRGRHVRRVVNLNRFGVRPTRPHPESALEPADIAYWFDFNSPWCYLAASRIGKIARRQHARLTWRPIHLSNLFDRIRGRRLPEDNKAFLDWYRRDLRDWEEIEGLDIRYHPQHPLRPSRALRATLYAADNGLAEEFVLSVMRVYWTDGADISEIEVLKEQAIEVGLDGEAIAEVISGAAYKSRLDANLSDAVESGVFGVPTVVWGKRVFFGNDRLPLLERALSRRSP